MSPVSMTDAEAAASLLRRLAPLLAPSVQRGEISVNDLQDDQACAGKSGWLRYGNERRCVMDFTTADCAMSRAKVLLSEQDRILAIMRCPKCKQLLKLRLGRSGHEAVAIPKHPVERRSVQPVSVWRQVVFAAAVSV